MDLTNLPEYMLTKEDKLCKIVGVSDDYIKIKEHYGHEVYYIERAELTGLASASTIGEKGK